MGDNLTRTDKAGCCGCLTGLIIGVILLVTVGVKNQSPEYFFLIPLFGLFFGIIPHSIFSHDKEVRFGAGCICYSVFIIAGIIAFYNDVMSVFWGVIIAIVIIILLHLIRIGCEEDQKEKDRQIAKKFESALLKQCNDLLVDEDDSKK